MYIYCIKVLCKTVVFVFSLDKLLDSGLYTGEITELTGSPGSGKTQVIFCPASSSQFLQCQNPAYFYYLLGLGGKIGECSVMLCVFHSLCRCVLVLQLIYPTS